MLFPIYAFTMLAFEPARVIQKRLAEISRGGAQSADEVGLVFLEKAAASYEAMMGLMMGGTSAGTIARFRDQVADNELRLS